MRLRSKLTLTLLVISLLSAATVGGIAHWMLMRDFSAGVEEQAFRNFRQDLQAYMETYGSWDAAQRAEPMPRFIRRLHRERPEMLQMRRPPQGTLAEGRREPPFRFALLDGAGRLLESIGPYDAGELADETLRKQARPVEVAGQVVVWAAPFGVPNLSAQDRAYLETMRKALISGVLAAGTLAVLLGLFLGRRMSRSLDEVTEAVRNTRAGGELQVPVRSRDEIGDLATAFNRMSRELADAHRELRDLSIRDPLTGLFNRRHFDAQAEQLYAQAERYGRPFSVMVGDLDHFKQINDNWSHATGDAVLRCIAGLIRDNLRKSDVVARYGGEEFVIAFAETGEAQAAQFCEMLRERIETAPWEDIQPGLRVTMSMGVCGEQALGSAEKMLNAADALLYEAKHAGRNRVARDTAAV